MNYAGLVHKFVDALAGRFKLDSTAQPQSATMGNFVQVFNRCFDQRRVVDLVVECRTDDCIQQALLIAIKNVLWILDSSLEEGALTFPATLPGLYRATTCYRQVLEYLFSLLITPFRSTIRNFESFIIQHSLSTFPSGSNLIDYLFGRLNYLQSGSSIKSVQLQLNLLQYLLGMLLKAMRTSNNDCYFAIAVNDSPIDVTLSDSFNLVKQYFNRSCMTSLPQVKNIIFTASPQKVVAVSSASHHAAVTTTAENAESTPPVQNNELESNILVHLGPLQIPTKISSQRFHDAIQHVRSKYEIATAEVERRQQRALWQIRRLKRIPIARKELEQLYRDSLWHKCYMPDFLEHGTIAPVVANDDRSSTEAVPSQVPVKSEPVIVEEIVHSSGTASTNDDFGKLLRGIIDDGSRYDQYPESKSVLEDPPIVQPHSHRNTPVLASEIVSDCSNPPMSVVIPIVPSTIETSTSSCLQRNCVHKKTYGFPSMASFQPSWGSHFIPAIVAENLELIVAILAVGSGLHNNKVKLLNLPSLMSIRRAIQQERSVSQRLRSSDDRLSESIKLLAMALSNPKCELVNSACALAFPNPIQISGIKLAILQQYSGYRLGSLQNFSKVAPGSVAFWDAIIKVKWLSCLSWTDVNGLTERSPKSWWENVMESLYQLSVLEPEEGRLKFAMRNVLGSTWANNLSKFAHRLLEVSLMQAVHSYLRQFFSSELRSAAMPHGARNLFILLFNIGRTLSSIELYLSAQMHRGQKAIATAAASTGTAKSFVAACRFNLECLVAGSFLIGSRTIDGASATVSSRWTEAYSVQRAFDNLLEVCRNAMTDVHEVVTEIGTIRNTRSVEDIMELVTKHSWDVADRKLRQAMNTLRTKCGAANGDVQPHCLQLLKCLSW